MTHANDAANSAASPAEVRNDQLQEALKQKTALLHEVDHRVKNNLQLISSLLLLQVRRTQNEAVRQALRAMLERVSAVATVHRRLFQSEDIERFDVADFLRDLTADLAAASGRDDIRIHLDLDHVAVPAAQAAPLALVANELIGNAIKHAFTDGRAGQVAVTIRRQPDAFDMTISDDGVGRGDAPPGFGSTIVQLLSQQLRAQVDTADDGPGVRTRLVVPVAGA